MTLNIWWFNAALFAAAAFVWVVLPIIVHCFCEESTNSDQSFD